jgi:glycosyltransferase involved in cell wall biosynthesis
LRLLYVVTEDWYFLSHRLPMARSARAAGFEVHVATRVQDGAAAIEREGFVLHPVGFARGRLSPGAALRTVAELRRLYRSIDPAIAHHVSLQASLLGSMAALGRRTACINALTGLGFTYASDTTKAKFIRPAIRTLIKRLFGRPRSVVLVQNPADRDEMIALGLAPDKVVLIPGSGVEVDALQPLPEPPGPPVIAYVGRLLEMKGIRTLVEAHRLLRTRGAAVDLLIAGTPDPANPASIPEREAAGWNAEPGIRWLGHVDDIRGLWSRAHIAVLPSRREGIPKSLLEAAAFGRPMIATDVPGCREVVRHDRTGLLVPANDPAALANAIAALAAAPALRARYGAAARQLAVDEFSAEAIGRQTAALYHTLAQQSAGPPT